MRKKQASSAAVVVALSLALAGCFGSSEPGASDMLDAVRKNEQFRAALATMAPVRMPQRAPGDTRIVSDADIRKQMEAGADEMLKNAVVEKTACVAAQGAPGFICDFRWGIRKDGQVQYQAAKGRFFKASDGWQFSPA